MMGGSRKGLPLGLFQGPASCSKITCARLLTPKATSLSGLPRSNIHTTALAELPVTAGVPLPGNRRALFPRFVSLLLASSYATNSPCPLPPVPPHKNHMHHPH